MRLGPPWVYAGRSVTTILRCPNCHGQIRFDSDPSLTVCAYCGAQVRGDTAPQASPAAAHLAESISLAVSDTLSIPLLAAGTALPTSRRETIASARDDQDSVTVKLVAGEGRALLEVSTALQARKPRGMPAAQLSIEVGVDGTVRVELREEGTTHTVSATARIAVAQPG